MSTGNYTFVLNGTAVGCGRPVLCPSVEETGTLVAYPDGLGLPELRTSDIEFTQRDGRRFGNDFYTGRTVTLAVTVTSDDCPDCDDVRQQVDALMRAWGRDCGRSALIIYPGCFTPGLPVEACERLLSGPFVAYGRPRFAGLTWGPDEAQLLLRFDAEDHRLYVADDCGNPIQQCVTAGVIPAATGELCFTGGELCFTGGELCFTAITEGIGGTQVEVCGGICPCPTVTFDGPLSDPMVSVGSEMIGFFGDIPAGQSIVIDGSDGTAVNSSGDDVTRLVRGVSFCLPAGTSTVDFTAEGTGSVTLCYPESQGWV